MNIPNPRGESLQQLLPLIQARYPNAVIKKVFLTPESIFVPQSNFKFVIRRKTSALKIDHTLPVLWALGAIVIGAGILTGIASLINGSFTPGIGGAIWVILGVLVMKYFFQILHKERFQAFKNEVADIVSGFDFDKKPA